MHRSNPQLALVVDDDLANREATSELLENFGYHVLTAENGQRALEVLKEQPARPKLIMLDLMMPVMNGWQFLLERRKDEALSEIPVIVVSAALDASAELPNVAGYLKKPVSAEQLQRLLDRIRSGSKAADTNASPAEGEPPRRDHLRVLLIQENDRDALTTEALLEQAREFRYQVRRGRGLTEGLEKEMLAQADVILLDMDLSGETGLSPLQKAVRRAPG